MLTWGNRVLLFRQIGARGRLSAQTASGGSPKTYTYDDQDRLVGQSDELG